jgi:ubiquinol-cytochrome c reductase cytochrome c1 subunit
MRQLGKYCLLAVLMMCCAAQIFAAAYPIKLEKLHVHIQDQMRIKRGAAFFSKHCMSCHAMKQLRYDKISQQAGMSYDEMPRHDPSAWNGQPPPDLSLIARVRGADWLYTYLQSFYKDPSTQLGSNNLLLDKTLMPNPFLAMQGKQILIVPYDKIKTLPHKMHAYQLLRLEQQGQMSSHTFDQHLRDLVYYLVYAGDPARIEREALGIWVLGFLLIIFVLMIWYKQLVWKKLKHPHFKEKA